MRRIIPREEWGAKDPKNSPTPIPTKQDRLWLHHSATSQVTGVAAPRLMQDIAFSRGFSDVSYTHVVDVDGNIYEGRGIGRMGAHTKGDNEDSWAICAVGNFETHRPPLKMIMAIAWLTMVYFKMKWDAQFGIDGGHRDAYARGYCSTNTACPGEFLHAKIGRVNSLASGMAAARPKLRYNQMPILREGAKSWAVKVLQRRLNGRQGYKLVVDGDFGPATLKAVNQTKAKYDLKPNGIVGAGLWKVLGTTYTKGG